jgi:hypothetical protein
MNDRGPTCPLCDDECKSHDHVWQHLHTHHRKSELIDAFFGGLDGEIVEAERADPDAGTPAGRPAPASRTRDR